MIMMADQNKRTRSASRSDANVDQSEILKGIREILERLTKIENQMNQVDSRLKELETSYQFHSNQVSDLNDAVEKLKAECSEIPKLQERAYDQEISQANKTLEIQGIPHNSSENLYDVVKAIANSVQTPITNENIDLAYRNKKKNIVVKFLQTHARDKIMNGFKAKTKTTPMLAKDLGFRSCSNRVYVNEFLLFDTRQLFFEVRKFQKRHNYKYSWTVNQKVYLRQAKGTPAIRVIDMSSLDDINTG